MLCGLYFPFVSSQAVSEMVSSLTNLRFEVGSDLSEQPLVHMDSLAPSSGVLGQSKVNGGREVTEADQVFHEILCLIFLCPGGLCPCPLLLPVRKKQCQMLWIRETSRVHHSHSRCFHLL